jgi:hypothetical protein
VDGFPVHAFNPTMIGLRADFLMADLPAKKNARWVAGKVQN